MVPSLKENHLVVLVGPTAVGKTEVAIKIAEVLKSGIISADSRQFYKEIPVGTAHPSEEQLKRVKHYFIANKSIFDYYNVFMFETDVLGLLKEIFNTFPIALMTGGSGLYIDAVCNGIDDIPDVDPVVRAELVNRMENEGVESLRFELKRLDPVFYSEVDLRNKKRILRALEVCISSGKPFSGFRTSLKRERDFKIIKIGLYLERDILYERINRRVDTMIEDGLIDEARPFLELKKINTLNTVGYKELFDFFEGKTDMEAAVNLIKRNTRRFAKRQMTWFNRDKDIKWFNPEDSEDIIEYIRAKCGGKLFSQP